MFRSSLVVAVSMLAATAAYAGAGSVPIIIYTPAVQPGDSCIPDGIGSGEETRASNGATVMTTGVHGANATRCPDPKFPNLASTEKIPSDEERRVPTVRCVTEGAQVGTELTVPFYGRATIVEVDPGSSECKAGVPAKIVATAVYRASRERDKPASPLAAQASAPVREPTEEDIQRTYDQLVAAAKPVQEYHVRHILVDTRADALAALERIRSGQAFADVAAEVSTDTGSKKMGGDLGWTVPSVFIDEFAKSMVGLAPAGLTAEPVKTKFGWHVIELLETKVGKDSFPPLSLVRARIAAGLRSVDRTESAVTRVPAKAVCRKMAVPVVAADAGAAEKGTVVAEIRVENGRVADILKLSGPSAYYPAVTDALKKYECDRLDRPTIAVQSFEF